MTTTFIKPTAKVIGENGNVYVTLGICSQALKKAGYKDKAIEMKDKVLASESYDAALQIMMEYCEFK